MKAERASALAAIGVASVSGGVLAGWAAGIEPLKRVLPGLVAMNPVTAIAFLAAALALALRLRPEPSSRRAGAAPAAFVALVGALKLADYAGLGLRLDQVLFRGQLFDPVSGMINRMAPNTAAAFALSGAALLLLDARVTSPWVATALAGATLTIAFAVLEGYALQIGALYQVAGHIPMALHTALCFILLGAGILLARPEREPVATLPGPGDAGRMLRRLLPPAALGPLVLGWLSLQGQALGFYGFEMGTAIYGMAISAAAIVVLWRYAITVAEAERVRDEGQRQIQEAVGIKSDFISMVSHELRTPLSAIKLSIDIVEDATVGPLNKEQEKFLASAKRNVDRLVRLVTDVLDFQKLDLGKLQFRMKPHDVNEIARETSDTFRPLASAKGLTLILETADKPAFALCDHDRVVQVLTNYLNNAFKFTKKGEVTIEVRHEAGLVRVAVRDQGIGIPPDEIGKLFQTFQQLSGGREAGGTGLGLALCKKIVAEHGGAVGADSRLGEGSTFWFTLPETQAHG